MNLKMVISEKEELMKKIQELENEVIGLRRQADHDGLTGCLRREAFVSLIEKRRAFGLLGRDQSLVIMDIDHFKHINDRFGHQVGDEVLQKVAQTLQRELPLGSLLCRMGGEEFIAVIPQQLTSSLEALEKLRLSFSENEIETKKGQSISVTLSFGLVAWDSDTLLFESSARADAALYRAKNNGRNQIAVEGLKKSA